MDVPGLVLPDAAVVEAEVLLGSGEHRSYVKARAVCAEGSVLLAVVGPGGADVPVPTGSARG